jgi:hypothetical protein
MHSCPLSRISDGQNDVTIVRSNQSTSKMTSFVLNNDKGDFFDKNGKFKDNGMEYYKCLEWELKPRMKGPHPDEAVVKTYTAEQKKSIASDAIYAIDGERYPAQDVKGRVLPSVLNIHY